MVKSEILFHRLVSIDALIAFSGVIPSASDLQMRLTSLLEQLNHALIDEACDPQESEALCRALCDYFDRRLTEEEQTGALSWERCSLRRYFYGHGEEARAAPLPIQLEKLLETAHASILSCAWQLLIMVMQIEAPTEPLLSLRARYLAALRPAASRRTSAAQAWGPRVPVPAGAPRLMVFILGPFARKWFSHADLTATGGGEIVWAAIDDLPTLITRLSYMAQHHPTTALLAFFPLLADGLASGETMNAQIAAWQRSFSGTRWPCHLPCLITFYTRLSQQRYPHDPDRAIWQGSLTTQAPPSFTLDACVKSLATAPADIRGEDALYVMQRRALTGTLIGWLEEEQILQAIQHLFDGSPLEFAGAMVADYGQGFTRHGAWSRWLERKFGILPGLSSSIALPPLPVLPLPPVIAPAPEEIAAPAPSSRPLRTAPAVAVAVPVPPPSSPPPPPRRRWPIAAPLLLLLLVLIAFFIIHTVEAQKGSPDGTASRVAESLSLSGTAPLFRPGSSALLPESEKMLEELVPALVRLPERQYLIIGHSDNTGSAAVNMALSTARAEAIRDWLVKRTGLAAGQFMIEGAGNTRPVASNETQQGRAQNRRVEIIPLSQQSTKD